MILDCILILYCIINIAIAIYDFSFFRIPNVFLTGLLGLYVIYAPFYLGAEDILKSLVTFAVMLAVSFGLFSFKIIGGGDAKYLSVISLWVGSHGVFPFVFVVSLVGGGLAVLYLLLRDHVGRFSDWIWIQIQRGETRYSLLQQVWIRSGAGPEKGKRENLSFRMVPYGIAIAAGAITTVVFRAPLL